MESRTLLDTQDLYHTINRLSYQLIENYEDFENTVLISLQPRGVYFGDRIKNIVEERTGKTIKHGYLDNTFYRDDFRRDGKTLEANKTKIDFLVEGKTVILIDDVLFSGRSVRAGLDALMAFGRPTKVELMVLIDRRYTRHLPISPNYVGRTIDTIENEKVRVEWSGVGEAKEDRVLLLTQ